MTQWKSLSCVSKTTGLPRTAFANKDDADRAARSCRDPMVSYFCDPCRAHHLSPKSRQTPSRPCVTCRGRDGRSKAGYDSEDDALRRAELLLRGGGAPRLRAYRGPCGYWHLTSRRA